MPAAALPVRADRVDLIVWSVSGRMDPRFLQDPGGNDVWFEADLPTVADRVLHRWSDQSRNARHPLFPLFATIPAHILKSAGAGDRTALRLLVACFAALWTALLYLLVRALTPSRLDALIFTALAHSSAAAMFWLPVLETYTLGSITVMAALALCAWDPGGRAGAAVYTAAAAFSLSVTTSNWVSGLSAAASRKPFRQALQISANSLTAVVVLWALQHLLFSSAPFFIGEGAQTRYILPHGLAGILQSLRAALSHSMVMPAIAIAAEPKWGSIMSVQESGLGSGGLLPAAATGLWLLLLGGGMWALATQRSPLRLPLALASAGHVLIYAIYGEESFLYTLHLIPLLVGVAAFTTHTRLRPAALASGALLTAFLAVHNARAFAGAMRFFDAGYR